MFGIKNKCKTYHKIKICNKNNIVNISNSTCLPKLLIGEEGLCEFSNADHIETIEEISSGLIMVNNFNGTLEWNNNMQKLEGTYVINFFNETLTINGKEFNKV